MSECGHTKTVRGIVRYIHPWTGELVEDIEYIEESCQADIDLHRYKCTRCGKIGYYSGAAKNFYEKGIKSKGIEGLE